MKNSAVSTDGLVVIIDLTEVIKEYIAYNQFYRLYAKFPLQCIITEILSVRPYDNFTDSIWIECEKRLGSSYDDFDTNHLDIFYDTLASSLDERIRIMFPTCDDYAEYVLDKWINSTTIVLVKNVFI